jgi:hypothetical protein
MKAHIGVDMESWSVRTVVGTATHVADVTQAHRPVHGEEKDVFADAGYQSEEKRSENARTDANWHLAMKRGQRRAPPETEWGADRADRSAQGEQPGQGGAFLSCPQEPVRPPQGPLPGLEEEHGPTLQPVWPGQSVSGASAAHGARRPKVRPEYREARQNGAQERDKEALGAAMRLVVTRRRMFGHDADRVARRIRSQRESSYLAR